jgi:hypothetical protein
MRVNINHPSFVSFLEGVSNSILTAIKLDNYFNLTNEKKMPLLYAVFTMIKNMAKIKSDLTDLELRSFIIVLCKKNEEVENYEFAALLSDITKNFDVISDMSSTTTKKINKTIKKTDTKNNG